MLKSRNYSIKTIKLLYGVSGGRCSRCKCELISPETFRDEKAQIGKIAHIVAFSENGPRSDPNFPENMKNNYENLILLCPNCHDLIDQQPNHYNAKYLKKMKNDHEKWVSTKLDESISNIDSAELEIAVKNIVSNKYFNIDEIDDFDLVNIKEKINKNNLNSDVQALITKGLFGVKEVKKFIKDFNKFNPEFVSDLKFLFKEKYLNLKKTNNDNNEIFFDLWNDLSNNYHSFNQQAASLSLLCYMFESCEVFEK